MPLTICASNQKGPCKIRCERRGEGEVSRFYFHCSDGGDLILDREGIEVEGSDVLWWALRAAARLMNALPSYDEWSAWTVAVSTSEVHSLRRCHSQRTATVVCARRRGPIDGHSPHRRTSTRPEARGIIDAHQARSVPFHHQRTCAEADLLRSADGRGELVPLAPTHRLSQSSPFGPFHPRSVAL
jgi:hypothetical protein